MKKRGYRISQEWLDKNYRGKKFEPYENLQKHEIRKPIYQEHDHKYLFECLENLGKKNVRLNK